MIANGGRRQKKLTVPTRLYKNKSWLTLPAGGDVLLKFISNYKLLTDLPLYLFNKINLITEIDALVAICSKRQLYEKQEKKKKS